MLCKQTEQKKKRKKKNTNHPYTSTTDDWLTDLIFDLSSLNCEFQKKIEWSDDPCMLYAVCVCLNEMIIICQQRQDETDGSYSFLFFLCVCVVHVFIQAIAENTNWCEFFVLMCMRVSNCCCCCFFLLLSFVDGLLSIDIFFFLTTTTTITTTTEKYFYIYSVLSISIWLLLWLKNVFSKREFTVSLNKCWWLATIATATTFKYCSIWSLIILLLFFC